jgi:hypothetical protein
VAFASISIVSLVFVVFTTTFICVSSSAMFSFHNDFTFSEYLSPDSRTYYADNQPPKMSTITEAPSFLPLPISISDTIINIPLFFYLTLKLKLSLPIIGKDHNINIGYDHNFSSV